MSDYATRQQPGPTGDGPSVTDWLVDALRDSGLPKTGAIIEDILARRELGRARYGDELRVGNGRDPGVDAYQELLDAAVYLAQLEMQYEVEGVARMLGTVLAMAGALREGLEQRDRQAVDA